MGRRRVLFIKHGFSETCDHKVSSVVSLGDVFRCTCLLEAFCGWDVTWITANAAADLLAENHLIDHLYLADEPKALPEGAISGPYDMLVNLEKQKDWCEFAAAVSAENRYGFRDWAAEGDEAFYPASAKALSTALQRQEYRPLQETLFATVGLEWQGERYRLGYQPRVSPIYDIGLNYHVGSKWPTKAWPRKNWDKLYEILSPYYSVSWQQSLNSVRHYIDWVSSNRLLITCDSLGLHLALGLRRQVVALFGPTSAEQIYLYGLGVKLSAPCVRACVPCFRPHCDYDESCMDMITVEMVVDAVRDRLAPRRRMPLPPAEKEITVGAASS